MYSLWHAVAYESGETSTEKIYFVFYRAYRVLFCHDNLATP